MNFIRSIFSSTVLRAVPQTPRASVFFSQVRHGHQYRPRFVEIEKQHKGRVKVKTGGSSRGTSLAFGKFGIRLQSKGVRISAQQLQEAENVIMRVIRPLNGVKMYPRQATNIAVCTKGNETRMGKGKGPFDYWAVRVPTGKMIFELDGDLHEQVAREALRLAASKLPGIMEFVTVNSPKEIIGFQPAEKKPKTNVFEEMKTDPSKKWANRVMAKNPNFAPYR
ncbi:ribosomal protein L10e/L16 [Dipodascopsis uninucleata]